MTGNWLRNVDAKSYVGMPFHSELFCFLYSLLLSAEMHLRRFLFCKKKNPYVTKYKKSRATYSRSSTSLRSISYLSLRLLDFIWNTSYDIVKS